MSVHVCVCVSVCVCVLAAFTSVVKCIFVCTCNLSYTNITLFTNYIYIMFSHFRIFKHAQVGIGGVVKLADFDELGRLGGARAHADGCSAPEVLRKVPDPCFLVIIYCYI